MRKSVTSSLIAAIDPQIDETWKGKIFFTLDVDWASDDILHSSIALFRERGLRCTIFATHGSPYLGELEADESFEIGLHPNYNGLLSPGTRQDDAGLDRLRTLFPSAMSVRSHSLVQSSRLQNDFVRYGLTHECNTYIPFDAGLKLRPWTIWNGLIKVPFVFADDCHLYGGDADRGIHRLLDTELCVVAFHPIHLFLNTDSVDTYERYKRGAHDGQPIDTFVNRDRYGVRDIFNAIAARL